MRFSLQFAAAFSLLALTPLLASADIPYMVNHQGIVKVSGVPFTGTGFFKFGIVNVADNYLWTNDGTRLGQPSVTPPADAVTIGVVNGNYSIRLGDAGLTNMVTIPATVFENDDVKLRVYFNDGVNGEVALLPDQPVTAVPYAYHAHTADTVPGYIDGGVLSNDETDPTNSLHITDLICRDDQNIANIQVPAMSKRVDANWAAGDGSGGLDAGTIGGARALVNVWAIGDSLGRNHGDIIFSRSGLTPGLPAGYDIKRYLGARLWAGTEWTSFVSSGMSRHRTTHFHGVTVDNVTLSTSWSTVKEVDMSSVVPTNWLSTVHVGFYADNFSPLVKLAAVVLRNSNVTGTASLSRLVSRHDTETVNGLGSSDWIGLSQQGRLFVTVYTDPVSECTVNLLLYGYTEEL